MTTETTTQPEVPTRQGVVSPGPWLRIARLGALVFMAFCIVNVKHNKEMMDA